jgi:HAMP domain-containing protein
MSNSTAAKRRHLGRSIFTKQLAFYLLFILLTSGIISVLFFATARKHLEEEVGKKLQYIARISTNSVPFERLDLIRGGDENSRMVLRMKEKLADIQDATGVRNIFVFRADKTSLLDLNPVVQIGSTYPLAYFTPSFLHRLQTGDAVNTKSYRTAGDKIVISAYAPVSDLDGHLFAVVAVDGGAGLEIIAKLRSRLYWLTFGSVAFAILLALFFARSITSPVRHIAQTAVALGGGNYAARATVESRDEVGILADSINVMAEQVRNRDAALKEMAAGVAHEIRNPLNSIKLLVSLLDEELGEEKDAAQNSTIETLHYEIGKLNRFIEEFLTYSRPISLIRDQVSAASLVSRCWIWPRPPQWKGRWS